MTLFWTYLEKLAMCIATDTKPSWEKTTMQIVHRPNPQKEIIITHTFDGFLSKASWASQNWGVRDNQENMKIRLVLCSKWRRRSWENRRRSLSLIISVALSCSLPAIDLAIWSYFRGVWWSCIRRGVMRAWLGDFSRCAPDCTRKWIGDFSPTSLAAGLKQIVLAWDV